MIKNRKTYKDYLKNKSHKEFKFKSLEETLKFVLFNELITRYKKIDELNEKEKQVVTLYLDEIKHNK